MSDDASNNAGKTRGKPFKRGNTHGKGRPAGSRNKASLAVDRLLDGEAENITRKAIELALEGDGPALRLCLERIAPPRKGRPVSFPLPPIATADDLVTAVGAVVTAMAGGELTPEEAATISGVLDFKRRSLETVELEKRLAALELRQGLNHGNP